MNYYLHIYNGEITGKGSCPVEGENWETVEISKEIYDLTEEKGLNYYIYSDGEIVINPNYEQEETEKENIERNKEIDEKIKELQIMALPDILEGNKENIDLYNEVIAGLEAAKL